jgi:hypothetical protein
MIQSRLETKLPKDNRLYSRSKFSISPTLDMNARASNANRDTFFSKVGLRALDKVYISKARKRSMEIEMTSAESAESGKRGSQEAEAHAYQQNICQFDHIDAQRRNREKGTNISHKSLD